MIDRETPNTESVGQPTDQGSAGCNRNFDISACNGETYRESGTSIYDQAKGSQRKTIDSYFVTPERKRCRCASRHVPKHVLRLLNRDPREELHEFSQRHTVLQVLKQSRHWNARAAKHPGTTDALGIPFDRWAVSPGQRVNDRHSRNPQPGRPANAKHHRGVMRSSR
jgi:hypothetical protein